MENNRLLQDGFGPDFKEKTRTYAGCSALPDFLLQAFVLLPLWAFLVLPIMLIYLAVMAIVRMCVKGPKKIKPFKDVDLSLPTDALGAADRPYDFILMGATGFTGNLAAEYIAVTYGAKKYKWAICGRSQNKLEIVKKRLVELNSEMAALDIVLANSLDSKQTDRVAKQAKLVMSTVGPFAKYGTPLVISCARYGTHYVDITGEIGWVRHVIENLDKTARTTGARIVSCCGQDSVPWDIVTFAAAEAFKKRGDNLVDIRIFEEFKGSASGGTISTLFTSFQSPLARTKSGFNPMEMDAKGSRSLFSTKAILPKLCYSYNPEIKQYVAPFVMAPVNSNVVRRSNALLGYAKKLKYVEVETHSGCMAAFLSVLQTIWFASAIFFPPFKTIMMCFLPDPGQGPTREQMREGYLKVTAIGRSEKMEKAIVKLGFTVDPAYEDTARMMVECGLCSLDESANKEAKSGVLSPMAAFGSLLVERLQANGRGIFFSVSMQ